MQKNASLFDIGVFGLSASYDYDIVIYILRSLYVEIFKAKKRKETKQQLHRRILKFERENKLPGYFSSMHIDELLLELDDAQYFYPIRKREVTFPTFH